MVGCVKYRHTIHVIFFSAHFYSSSYSLSYNCKSLHLLITLSIVPLVPFSQPNPDKMPSKGITVYSYISVEGYVVEFTVPKNAVRNTATDNFTSKDLQVDSSNIQGFSHYTGRFEWKAFDSDGNIVGSKYNDINSLTGNLEGGSMTSTVGSPIQRHAYSHVLADER